jgi:hypothetical protein
VWNEKSNQELFTVFEKPVDSIKRVFSTFNYIFNTEKEGVCLLTIKDLASNRFSIHHLFKAENGYSLRNDKLDLQVTHSNLIIAAINNKFIKVMEVNLVGK